MDSSVNYSDRFGRWRRLRDQTQHNQAAKSVYEALCSLDVDALAELDDDDAIRSITAIRGFGTWSAEIYLMFSLQRSDIFPANDLALQVAIQRLKGLESRPNEKQARQAIEHWAPWRSAGSLFLWHFYRGAPT